MSPPRDLNPIYVALGEIKVEHLGTLKNAFHQLEVDWCKQLAAGGKKHGGPRGRRQRTVRSAVHRGRENRSRAGQKPSPIQNDGEVGEAQRPHSPNSTALLACSNVDQQYDKEDEQQQQEQQACPRGRSVSSARQATPGQSTRQAPHADMKRKAPGDGAGAGSRPGPKSQGIVTIGDALRQASPKPQKKKQRPPWVDNSIPGLPRPFTSDPGPSGFDGQDVASTPADKAAEGDTNAAAPATPLAAPHPDSSPAVPSKQQQPPSPSRIPRHPHSDETPPSTAGTDHSLSRIPHVTPSDPVQTSSSPPRQRKQWGAPVAAQEVASLAAAGVPVQPPQLRRGSPGRPVAGASPAESPPPSSIPTSTPPQPQQPGGFPAHPFPVSALRASAMENLKEGRHRAMQSRTPMPPNTSLAAVPSQRSLSMEEPPRPGSGDEADPGSAPKRSSFTQLPPALEAIPGSPAHASPRAGEPPHSNSQPITEAKAGDAKPTFALGKDVAASVDGAAAALTSAYPAEEAQGAGGQQPGEVRKQGYLRKLSALKRTVAPPPGPSPPHSSAGSSQTAKQGRPHLPPVPEPAVSRQDSGDAQAQQQQQQQQEQQLPSPSGRLHVAIPRPVSEPAVSEARQEVPVEGRPRRVSDLGSPTKMQQAPNRVEGGPFGWRGSHDSSAGPGGPGSDGAAPSAAAEAPPAGAGSGGWGVAAAGGSRPGRARWQVAPEARQAAWRWEGDASSLARSSSSPFPDAAKPASGPPTPPPHKAPNSSAAQSIPVPSDGKTLPQQGSCLLPPASPLLANSPSRPAVRPSSPSPYSSLQRPPTSHQEISAAAAAAAVHGYAPAPLTGSAASAPLSTSRRISAPGTGPPAAGPPFNASRKPPPHTAYPHIPLPPAATAWLPPSAYPDHGRPPTHPQVPWSLPPYPSAPSASASSIHGHTAYDHNSHTPHAYHHQPNATMPRSMVGGHHQPLHQAPLPTGYPSSYLTTQQTIPVSISSSPAATPPWMTLRDPSAYANGNSNHKHPYGGLDAALNALQQQQQQQQQQPQQYAQYGARRTINGQAQEPSRIMDIMRMSSSKLVTGWETAAPHEAATGPLSRFADVWRQRNNSVSLSEQSQEQHRHQEQLQAPASQPPAHPHSSQPEQQHDSHQQQQGEGVPPAMDRRQLKLQHAFNGLSLGEVLANSAKKEPPFPKKQANSNAQAASGVDAAKDK